MKARTFRLPEKFESDLRNYLAGQSVDIKNPGSLAASILKVSNFFNSNEGAKTPWEFWAAYMVYFFPLNFIRVQAALTECFRDFPWDSVSEIIDFGSGPGTVHAALENSDLSLKPILAIENESRATDIHQAMPWKRFPCRWADRLPTKISPGTLGIFSYSLLEESKLESRLPEFEHLLILTPSTRVQGRRLLEIRASLTMRGFHSWAPCTHQLPCPLLTQSQSDWCHDRIHFDAPEWFRKLEEKLPMKNSTLTFSYWFASRTQVPESRMNRARIIGDTLFEKGKVRQMVCRGSDREFLAWLTREGEAPEIPRGSIVELPPSLEKKSNELRGFR